MEILCNYDLVMFITLVCVAAVVLPLVGRIVPRQSKGFRDMRQSLISIFLMLVITPILGTYIRVDMMGCLPTVP